MGWTGMPLPVAQMPGMATTDQLSALASSRGTEADRIFVELMITHHEGGIQMAEYAAANADVAEVRDLAVAIRNNQRTEINELRSVAD